VYRLTNGRAVFASGSPFAPLVIGKKTFVPGQANNCYIFPGVGLGVVASQAKTVTDEMFFVAARVLSEQVTPDDLDLGRIFPSLSQIREVSLTIAVAVAKIASDRRLAWIEKPDDMRGLIKSCMYDPTYPQYTR